MFLYKPKTLRLQPAHNQQFTHEQKTRPLYDSEEFRDRGIFSFLHRNLMMVNALRAKSVFCKTHQISVNTMCITFVKREKTRF